MRILLLAPHPFYQERGTPIAVDLLLRALANRGEEVDVLTYHEGDNRDYGANISIHRISSPPFTKGIRPGFTVKKLICDLVMYFKASRMARARQYDCIHAVEESAFMAKRIGARHKIPYIFDMDSSMPQQIADKLPMAKPLLPLMRRIEAGAVSAAAVVVPMCDALAETAQTMGAKHIEVLRDISLLSSEHSYNPEHGFRKQLNLSTPTVLYIGNLESYQGIDLLIESFALTLKPMPDANLVLAGGREDDIRHYKEKVSALGIHERVYFLGPRPIDHMPDLFHDADIIVSPRTQGKNTPMKIYSYLDAGRAILATDLPTHTQVLTPDVAKLVPPTPEAMSQAIQELLMDQDLCTSLANRARKLARERYSFPAFETSANRIYDHIAHLPNQNRG